jgi:2-dehydropantoate 2-reductase
MQARTLSSTNRQPTDTSYDWVVVSLKSSSLNDIPELILPLLDPTRTRVLAIMNGFIENDLIAALKEKSGQTDNVNDDTTPLQCCQALYGGMAFICCNRMGPAIVAHTYAGHLTAGAASTKSNNVEDDEKAFVQLFSVTSDKMNQVTPAVAVLYETSLLYGRWKKMLWNLPFNGISVAMGGITVHDIVTDPGMRELAFKVMDETIAVANADLIYQANRRKTNRKDDEPSVSTIQLLTTQDKEQMMAYSDTMGAYKTSTMLDLIHRRPMEVKYLFQKPVERAQQLNIPVPRLETLVTQIAAFQRMYGL